MSQEIPTSFVKRLADMGGRLPDGTPKLRLVYGPETKRAHGKLKGVCKYLNPDNGEAFNWWFVEQWVPPTMLGSRETWNEAFLGTYPADCGRDCCNHGFWATRFPICGANGEFVPISEATMDSIERKQFMDIQFNHLDEISRQEAINKLMAEREQNTAEVVNAQATEIGDDYFTHKEKEDNADNRAYSMPDGLTIKGIKEPIGKPKI